MTTPIREPGERRPELDRAPGDRYVAAAPPTSTSDPLAPFLWPTAVMLGTIIAFVVIGGLLTATAGLVIVAAFAGWLLGKLVGPPWRAGLLGLVTIVLGFAGIWLFGRLEGGVLDPVTYLLEVEGPFVLGLSLLAGGGLAAAASR